MRYFSSRASISIAAALVSLGCPDQPSPAGTAPSAPPSAAPSASASSAPAAAWYVGTWAGPYDARPVRIETPGKSDGLQAWAKGDGGTMSGTGSITVTVDAARRVIGSAQGSLGDLLLAGEVDGDTLRVQLRPKDPAGLGSFAGTLVLRRNGSRLEGLVRGSSGDSQTVREAPVKLELKR
jgi:hypothetical protein